MNWLRIVLDGLAMSLVFNAFIGMFWFIKPRVYAIMLPKEIKNAAAPYTKKEMLTLALIIYPIFIGMVFINTANNLKNARRFQTGVFKSVRGRLFYNYKPFAGAGYGCI